MNGGGTGRGLGDLGTIMTMYGAFPPPESPRYPSVQPQPYTPVVGPTQIIPPAIPTSGGALKADIKARIDWLKRELAQHEAWKLELATLERVLAAYDAPAPPLASGAEGSGNGQ